MGGVNGLGVGVGNVIFRQPKTRSKYEIYLFVLALFGMEKKTFVLVLFFYLD